ncbi:MAG: insulinase family protein [Opitutales bacterium]
MPPFRRLSSFLFIPTVGPVLSLAGQIVAAIPLDPAILHGRLENGLTYYILENGTPEDRVELRLVVNAGSAVEADDQRGAAHFVEHLCFRGTRNFPEASLVGFLERLQRVERLMRVRTGRRRGVCARPADLVSRLFDNEVVAAPGHDVAELSGREVAVVEPGVEPL